MSEAECLFCKIVNNQIRSDRVYEDDEFICFKDIHPQAPVHLLVVPRKHVASLADAYPEEKPSVDVVSRLLGVVVKVARKQGLLPAGFRTVINTNRNGGQVVFHLHAHLLGGEVLGGKFG